MAAVKAEVRPGSSRGTVQKSQGAVPGEASGFGIVGVEPVGLKEPVANAGVAVENHITAEAFELRLELVDARRRLVRVVISEVAEVGCF